MTEKELKIKSAEYRRKALQYIYKAKAGHTGGSLSCIDILNVLYNAVMNVSPENFSSPDRDRYIQSKGHSVEALYVILADKGFFPEKDLESMGTYNSHYIGHPTRKVNGIEQNTGALGHGLSLSVGTALAAKKDNRKYRVFTLLGDGELPEGSNWEAILTAAHYKLDNLCAVIDYNKLQITGPTSEVCNTDPIDEKFKSFGWSVQHVNGHDINALIDLFKKLPFHKGKPNCIIAHTIKGRGVSYMENEIKWHHGVPDEIQYKKAMEEIDLTIKTLAETESITL